MVPVILCCVCLFSAVRPLNAGGIREINDLGEAVRYLSGISDIELIPQDEAERYETLSRHPLCLNSCSRAALVACGLFSAYQVETLLDYRTRCGPICSPDELALVDGFDLRTAACLAFFLDFDPSTVPRRRFTGEASGFAALKIADANTSWQWMGRVKAACGGVAASVAAKSAWANPISLPSDIGCSLSYGGGKLVQCAVAGYFNASFGQGLCLWTGVQFENYSTPSSLMKRPRGIAPYTSSSIQYAMRGAGVQLRLGDFDLAAFYDCSVHRAGGNLTWKHPHGQIGATAWAFCRSVEWASGGRYGGNFLVSLDFQHTVGAVTLYGETTVLQSLLGARLPIGAVDFGLRAFWSKEEHNVTSSLCWLSANRKHSLDFGATLSGFPDGKGTAADKDAGGTASRQLKLLSSWTAQTSGNWSFKTRLSARLRDWSPRLRVDLRHDIRYDSGCWSGCVRLNGVYGVNPAGLCYAQGTWKRDFSDVSKTLGRLEVDAQAGLFCIDDWEDRIYVYQRDAPQSFSSPAMYGRGWWLAVFSSVKLWKMFHLYLRTVWTAYPWAREDDRHRKPSLSAKLQLVVSL